MGACTYRIQCSVCAVRAVRSVQVRAGIDKEIDELDERKRQLRLLRLLESGNGEPIGALLPFCLRNQRGSSWTPSLASWMRQLSEAAKPEAKRCFEGCRSKPRRE